MIPHTFVPGPLYSCTGCAWTYVHTGYGDADLFAEREYMHAHVYDNTAYWWGSHDEITRDYNNERG